MDLEAEIDRLYSVPLSQFVPARNDLVTRLRQEKRRDEAGRVKRLVKPSVAAWTVNQLYWKRRPMWDALMLAGDELRRQAGDPSTHSRLMQQRRQALRTLLAQAEGILTEGGHALGASTLKQIHDTLEAASIYGESLPDEPAGRLTRVLEPPGFEALLSMGAKLPPRAEKPTGPDDSRKKVQPSTPTGAALRVARARLAQAERHAARMRREAGQARSRAEAVGQRQQRCIEEMRTVEARLQELRERLDGLSQETGEAEASAEQAARRLAEAEAELEKARRKLSRA